MAQSSENKLLQKTKIGKTSDFYVCALYVHYSKILASVVLLTKIQKPHILNTG